MYVWLLAGLACYGLLCLLEEALFYLREKHRNLYPVRLILLFQDCEETVEWFVRRLHRVLRMDGTVKVHEVVLVDTESHDNTPVILEQLSRNHHLFHYHPIQRNAILSSAGNAIVVDCRHADWARCFRQIKAMLGSQSERKRAKGQENEGWMI
jgi:hypothetical protein